MEINKKIGELKISELLTLGKRFCSTDFAVRFYYNKQHPKFHKNREALVHAIRRAHAFGNSATRKRMQEFIMANFCLEN